MGEFEPAIEQTRAFEDEYPSLVNQALVRILPHVTDSLVKDEVSHRVMIAAEREHDELRRIEIVTPLVHNLQDDTLRVSVLRKAIRAVQEVSDGNRHAAALALLAPSVATLPPELCRQLWCEVVPLLTLRRRSDLLSDLVALKPVVLALTDSSGALAVFQAFDDIGRWWP